MTPILTKTHSVYCSEYLAFPSTSEWQRVQTRRKWVAKRHTTHIRINERPTLGLFPTRVPHSTNKQGPHNNASPTPQDVSGDSGLDPSMDPSSSRTHGTESKYIGKDCFFFLVHKGIPASFCLSTKYHTNNSVVFSLISLVYLQLISKTPVTKSVRTTVGKTTF